MMQGPEQLPPTSSASRPVSAGRTSMGSGRGYVELHAHSAFSFGDGASLPDELALAAAEQGHEALALTDHDGVWGAMEFAQACSAQGVRPIVGAELTVYPGERPPALTEHGWRGNCPPGCFHLTILVESATGWRNLSRLLTAAHAHTRPRPDRDPLPPAVSLAEVERMSEGLVCLSGCAREGALVRTLGDPGSGQAMALGRRLAAAFGPDRFRIELQRPLWRHDRARNRRLEELAGRLGVACVATGNVHMHQRSRAALQDALVAVRLCGSLEETEPLRRGNGSSHLATAAEMATRFREHPEAVAESVRLAERLRFDLTTDLGYSYPGSEDPGANGALAEICRARLEHRYGGTREHREATTRLEDELGLTRRLGLSGFFLLHFDILELAREVAAEVRGPDSARMLLPPGRGRGSSVSSIVCYLTGLSHIDPVRNELFLGRFLNEEINEAPDIDLDFPRDIRERLIPRIHERYGEERSALVAAFACYRSRSAVRELGKALGLPPGEIERVARTVDMYDRPESVAEDMELAIGAARARSGRWQALSALAREAWGLPRHASQHPGGMVLSTQPLVDICPIAPAAMEGRQIAQWDKDSCADAGFLKIDLLGLGMLSAVERCVDEIARVRGEAIDLSRIPMDDAATYEAIQRAETTGVFQIESRAQMQMLPRTLPRNLDDITVQVALVRPGPIQGGAVHPYLERKARLREDPGYEIPYPHPSLEPILRDTLGTIVFQEQVIQVAMALAGFSAGEAEGLRRAMSRKRSEEALMAYRERFIRGAIERGSPPEVGERVFEQVRGFSGFGFPKAHAAAFGLLAYQSTWLRVHYGPELLCALLNEQPMGFYPPDALIHEAQRRGFEVRPPDVNRSEVRCIVERDLAIRVGLGYVKGVRAEEMEELVGERSHGGSYGSLADIASRSGAGREALERLAWAGALQTIGVAAETGLERQGDARREDLWRVGVAKAGRAQGGQLSLPLAVPESPPLPGLSEWERIVADYASTGVTLGTHPMEVLRATLGEAVLLNGDLERAPNGTRVEIAGMVVARQRPATARGVVFMLLEDESGVANLVVLPPAYERHRLAVRTASFVRVEGELERRDGVVNVVVSRLEALAVPDAAAAEVRHIGPPAERETGRAATGDELARRRVAAGGAAVELEAAAPRPHSFGRRG